MSKVAKFVIKLFYRRRKPLGISNILALLGGVALFLFGMSLMGDSLKKVAGNKLEIILYKLSSTPLKGIILGTGVTAIIQSSSATSVMVVGFVNSGMMKVRQAIGVVMGAIIGTSITGWIICLSDLSGGGSGWTELLSTDSLAYIIALIGIVCYMFSKKSTTKNVGGILLGFAVLMVGMKIMSGSVSGLKTNETFINMLTRFSNPLLGILVGLAFTSVLQSASAAVGILQALAITGAITFDSALPIIMGIAIGAAVPVLLSALGAGADGKRAALSYLLVDFLGVIVFSVLFYTINAFVEFSFMGTVMTTVTIALTNTVFRAIIVILLAPFIGVLEKIGKLIIKDDAIEEEMHDADRLEDRFIEYPSLAVEQSRLAVNSMADKAGINILNAFALMENYSEAGYAAIEKMEDIIDRYEDKIGTYLMKVTVKELNSEQNKEVSKYLHTINDFERISDHALNIAECAKEIHEKDISFSPAGEKEILTIVSAVEEIIGVSIKAFTENNLELAYRVEPLEELIDNLCDEMKLHHIERLRDGACTFTNGFVFTDLLTNLERVSDHCSNLALALIELDSDSFDTHEYINSMTELQTEVFDRYYEEYSKKYVL